MPYSIMNEKQSVTEQFERKKHNRWHTECVSLLSDLGLLLIRNVPTSKTGIITICETAGKKIVRLYYMPTYVQPTN